MRDSRDIEQAVRTYGDAVWRACLVYLPPSEAEDAFQEAFLSYALHDRPFNDDGHKKAWLLRVAINTCKDALKAARRKDASLDALAESGQEPVATSRDQPGSALREVLDALNRLGDPPKTQLYLSLYEGYSAPEIARMCGMKLGTVYSWISRGKKMLREALS